MRSKRMKIKFQPYREKLSAAQIVDGINAAIRNARRLTDDAVTLLNLSRYPTAAALAILSIEESGKVRILRGLAVAPDEESLRFWWKGYTSHQAKNAAWIIPDLIEAGACDLNALSAASDPKSDHPEILDRIKQMSLYTDCLENVHWSEPEKTISDDWAGDLVDRANSLVPKEMTLKEMELWIEYMKPAYGTSVECQKEALLNFNKALIKEGLLEEGFISPEDFIFGIEEEDS